MAESPMEDPDSGLNDHPSSSTDVDRLHRAAANLPPPCEWSGVAVRLLQGVLYHDDSEQNWEILLRNTTLLSDYFAKLGLMLVVDEADAMAYLRQFDEEEWPNDYPEIPRLFRRQPLSYEATLLCVLLRDELRRFEEQEVFSDRCIIAQSDLLPVWQAFFRAEQDAVKLNRQLGSALRKLEDMKFVKQFEKEPPTWEVRRILKARVPLEELEKLRQALLNEVARRGQSSDSTDVKPTSTGEEESP
ncbi:MAG: DUF4194 domain-containing protein [Planctomycetes bacterium]|nr:DUF4194 domain-containing protein [Planctomycetota bacterium]